MASSTPPPLVGIHVPDDRVPAIEAPSTPCEPELPPSSQITIPSTEAPGSPLDPAASFKSEPNDDAVRAPVIPSSLTPPPSSQQPSHGAVAAPAAHSAAATQYVPIAPMPAGGVPPAPAPPSALPNGLSSQPSSSQQSSLVSPPATVPNGLRRDGPAAASSGPVDYAPPTDGQLLDATADELRDMLDASLAEQQRLKVDVVHTRFQMQLLSMQATEDAHRAAVELDMMGSEVDALRSVEYTRQARREFSAGAEAVQVQLRQLKADYAELTQENEALRKRLRAAKKVIQQKEEENISLREDRAMLLTRIRENREHFRELCSPGGIFHGALTPGRQPPLPQHQQQPPPPPPPPYPHQATTATPQQQHRGASRAARGGPGPSPGPGPGGHHDTRDHQHQHQHQHDQAPLTALIHVLNQANNSAPSTPVVQAHPPTRPPPRHTRNVQSLSALPNTPGSNRRRSGEHPVGLLPSADLVPQTEPARRCPPRTLLPAVVAAVSQPPLADVRERGRDSRESTISADDPEDIARQALEQAGLMPRASSLSQSQSHSQPHPPRGSTSSSRYRPEADEVLRESQASQVASEMLRLDRREGFEITAAREPSRDAAPAPAEKSAVMQESFFGPRAGEKRKHEERPQSQGQQGQAQPAAQPRRELPTSPKRLKVGSAGLGIKYGR